MAFTIYRLFFFSLLPLRYKERIKPVLWLTVGTDGLNLETDSP